MKAFPLVATRSFIQAARDAGYKSTSAALAELVDNAFEANASKVDIKISDDDTGQKTLTVTDNGCGMSPPTMQLALQFGGSTRFNSRLGMGRYGMGLPGGSLSQARRVVLESWLDPHRIWSTYLDVDEVASGSLMEVPPPTRKRSLKSNLSPVSPTGTIVTLTKCDRLDYQFGRVLIRHLQRDLGRIFRQHLYIGRELTINDETVHPSDPLFLREGRNLVGAEAYGPPLNYRVSALDGTTSEISVRFALLPIEQWHGLSNCDKNVHGISKGAGISILRAGREIDYGWHFMGAKRKENYDDWWRCEVSFVPELDELFGVTHTKQRINPTETINAILCPDLERIAHELNGIVRKRHLNIRVNERARPGVEVARERDVLLDPLSRGGPISRNGEAIVGTKYEIEEQSLDDVSFYLPSVIRSAISLVINREHVFYEKVYRPLITGDMVTTHTAVKNLQLVLLAAARAECSLKSRQERLAAERLRRVWGNVLTGFLA